ncbi:MAG: hypothetical protein F4039_03095 [Gammaproteobacteria bacterium]|nr:hypothetical protein [Gammaproteobacteria bacterium]
MSILDLLGYVWWLPLVGLLIYLIKDFLSVFAKEFAHTVIRWFKHRKQFVDASTPDLITDNSSHVETNTMYVSIESGSESKIKSILQTCITFIVPIILYFLVVLHPIGLVEVFNALNITSSITIVVGTYSILYRWVGSVLLVLQLVSVVLVWIFGDLIKRDKRNKLGTTQKILVHLYVLIFSCSMISVAIYLDTYT